MCFKMRSCSLSRKLAYVADADDFPLNLALYHKKPCVSACPKASPASITTTNGGAETGPRRPCPRCGRDGDSLGCAGSTRGRCIRWFNPGPAPVNAGAEENAEAHDQKADLAGTNSSMYIHHLSSFYIMYPEKKKHSQLGFFK